MKKLQQLLELVRNTARKASAALTLHHEGLIHHPGTADLRDNLRELNAKVRKVNGMCHVALVAFEDLSAVPDSRDCTSDYFYLETCLSILESLIIAVGGGQDPPGDRKLQLGQVNDFPRDPGQGDGVEVQQPLIIAGQPVLELSKMRYTRQQLASVIRRFEDFYTCLTIHAMHVVVSNRRSVQPLFSDTAASPGSEDDEDPQMRLARFFLQLSLPVHDNPPSPSYHAECVAADARNSINPEYPEAAVGWVSPLLSAHWEDLKDLVFSLMGMPPHQPGRSNFIQWLLQFARQSWPDHFGDTSFGSRSYAALVRCWKADRGMPHYVAASLGLRELCAETLAPSEISRLGLNPSKLLYCSLIGPSSLLYQTHMTLWDRINQPPYSLNQADVIRLCLPPKIECSPLPAWLWSPDTHPPRPPDYIAFLVCLRLRDADLFLEIFSRCQSMSPDFIELLHPGSFWEPLATRHEPCSSEEDRDYLNDLLRRLLDVILVRLLDIDTWEPETPEALAFDGAYKLGESKGLSLCAPGHQWLAECISDDADFEDIVRNAVREAPASLVRRFTQDPRWRPDIPYDPPSTDPAKASGGTLLHLAVESQNPRALETLETLISAGLDVEATDNRGRTALMNCETSGAFRVLLRHGANTSAQDAGGRNCWHSAAANHDVPTLHILAQEDTKMAQNMRVTNLAGNTPLAEAVLVTDGLSDTKVKLSSKGLKAIQLLCDTADGDEACLKSRVPVLHSAVKWGDASVVRSLLDLGADANQLCANGTSPLHHLNFSTDYSLVMLLCDVCTNAPIQRPRDKLTALEALFLNFQPNRDGAGVAPQPSDGSSHPSFAVLVREVLVALLDIPGVRESKNDNGMGLWERFCRIIVRQWAPLQEPHYAITIVSLAAEWLAQEGVMRRYEEETNQSGIPLFRDMSTHIPGAWPTARLTELYQSLLSKTSRLELFTKSTTALSLLNTAVVANATPLLDLLLERGVSVHSRGGEGRDRKTALEIACAPTTRTTKCTFEKLLSSVKPEHLNRLDSSSQGVIHLLANPNVPNRDQKLTALLEKGADPNLMRWGKTPTLVSFILERQIDAALILLGKGADPSLPTKEGMDAALASASRGCMRVLEKIRAMAPTDFNWARTCRSHFTIIHPGGAQVTTTASNCSALHLAAFNGYDLVLQYYLNNFKLDVNSQIQDDQRRPIHFAAISGSSSCIRVLHEHGADLRARARDGSTPLHTAVRGSQAQAVKMLLGLDPHSLADNEMMTPFMHALRIGFVEIIKLFVEVDKSPEPTPVPAPASAPDRQPQDPPLRTRMIGETIDSVVRSGDVRHCRSLLSVLSIEDFAMMPLKCEGCTPLILAIRENKADVLEWMLTNECKGFTGSCPAHFRRSRQLGFDALNLLCERPRLIKLLPKMLEAYLREGIDWTSACLSPIHMAARANNIDAIDDIVRHVKHDALKYSSKFLFGASDSLRQIPKGAESVDNLKSRLTKYILDQRVTGDEIPEVAAPGWTPLHIAASHGNEEALKQLLILGANPDVEDEELNRPIHLAVRNNFESCVQILISGGADPNRYHGQGSTPLMAAVEAGNISIARMLVDAKADIHVADPDGMGLLNIGGERSKNPAMMHYLLGLGLSPYRRDKAGYMPVDDMVLNFDMLGYVMNGPFDFGQVVELNKGLISLVIELNRGSALPILQRLFRRLSPKQIEKLINTSPRRFVSALYNAVYRDMFAAIDILVKNGADVNKEGSVEGTPLIAACARGRLRSVKKLVFYGARIAYTIEKDGVTIVRDALGIASQSGFTEIQDWLLVGQYTEKRFVCGRAPGEELDEPIRLWSGPWSAAYRLQGMFYEHPREPRESRIAYMSRMSALRRSLRGQVVRVEELVRSASEGVAVMPAASRWDPERMPARAHESRSEKGGVAGPS